MKRIVEIPDDMYELLTRRTIITDKKTAQWYVNFCKNIFVDGKPYEEREKWHPYPKEKPTESGEYNVSLKYTKTVTSADYDPEYDEWRGNDNFYIPNHCITAWAELPEYYEEEDDEKSN